MLNSLKHFVTSNLRKVEDINRKYAAPQIHMSKMVRISLLFLRLYLLLLVGLLVYKFITLIR